MDIEKLDNTIAQLLQRDIRFRINNHIFREGKLILFKHNYFVYDFIICQNMNKKTKKLEIPIPFNNYKKDNIIYFDYNFKTLAGNNINLYNIILETFKKCKSKFCNKLLEIEVVNEI